MFKTFFIAVWLGLALVQAQLATDMQTDIAPSTDGAAFNGSIYTVYIGASTEDQRWQFNNFYPNDITIRKGDTIRWILNSDEPHTVTFVPDAQKYLKNIFFNLDFFSFDYGSNNTRNDLFLGLINVTEEGWFALSPYMTSFGDDTLDDDNEVHSSGLLWRDPASNYSYSLTFNEEGEYFYECILHTPLHIGRVIVIDNDDDWANNSLSIEEDDSDEWLSLLLSPEEVAEKASQQINSSLSMVTKLDLAKGAYNTQPAGRLASRDSDAIIWTVKMQGDLHSKAALMRFVPENITIHVGDTVEFVFDSIMVHNVVFNTTGNSSEFSQEYEEDIVIRNGSAYYNEMFDHPSGGESYTGGFATSGYFYPFPYHNYLASRLDWLLDYADSTQFVSWNITFDAAGVYPYVCTLHRGFGMKGVVTVLDSDLGTEDINETGAL